MSALSVSVVIHDDVETAVRVPTTSWDGYVVLEVMEGCSVPVSLFIEDGKARALVEQLTAALATKVG